MANHASAKKRARQDAKKRLAIKKLRDTTDKKEAESFLPKVISMLDKLAKSNRIHKNKASNLKSKLTRHVSNL